MGLTQNVLEILLLHEDERSPRSKSQAFSFCDLRAYLRAMRQSENSHFVNASIRSDLNFDGCVTTGKGEKQRCEEIGIVFFGNSNLVLNPLKVEGKPMNNPRSK